MSDRQEKVANLIRERAAEYLGRENNKTSLISVTHATISPDLKKATIFITVLPDSKENAALMFVKRQLGDIREYLKDHMMTKVIPFLAVEIDKGEKNRQKIDELLRNS